MTIAELWEDTARLTPGQRAPWPYARLRDGGTVDLRDVPGPEAASHDDVYLTDLAEGDVAVANTRLGARLPARLRPAVFRWLISWQPYGGALNEPLAGSYALGIEPWVSGLPLGDAAAAGEAIELAPGTRLKTELEDVAEEGEHMAGVEFEGAGKVYKDGTRALEALDLVIEDGEFMVLVGPSGCGKTTALRMVAGLEEISEGSIRIGDHVVNRQDPGDRDIAMVFQNYAL